MARIRPLLAALLLLGLAACGEATGTGSTTSSSSPLAVGGGDTGTSSSSTTTAPTAAPTAAPTPPPTATPAPTPTPTPVPTQPPPTAAPVADTCGAPQNPWGYGFCSGSTISNPPGNFCSYFSCISNFWNGRGYVEQCKDGMFSKSGGISGSCSYHGGNRQALLQP